MQHNLLNATKEQQQNITFETKIEKTKQKSIKNYPKLFLKTKRKNVGEKN